MCVEQLQRKGDPREVVSHSKAKCLPPTNGPFTSPQSTHLEWQQSVTYLWKVSQNVPNWCQSFSQRAAFIQTFISWLETLKAGITLGWIAWPKHHPELFSMSAPYKARYSRLSEKGKITSVAPSFQWVRALKLQIIFHNWISSIGWTFLCSRK